MEIVTSRFITRVGAAIQDSTARRLLRASHSAEEDMPYILWSFW